MMTTVTMMTTKMKINTEMMTKKMMMITKIVMTTKMTMITKMTMTMQVKEKQAESARKSGRANKGKMKERADEIVEMPQAKVGLGAQRQKPRP